MKVLLVDDEQSLLDVFMATLHSGGFEVITANTGTEAVKKAKEEKPDIILLDQVMPDINGNQVLQILMQDPLTQSIPVAMLSNFNQDGLVQDAINLGAVDYILKYQIEPQDLISKINQYLQDRGHSTKAPVASAPTVPTTPPTPQPQTPLVQTPSAPTMPPPQTAQSTPPIPTTPPPPTIEVPAIEQKSI